jgi:sigma-54 dependent transcriptional regulator, acetoin dehydrogenase operon transcriptional activator AcoR
MSSSDHRGRSGERFPVFDFADVDPRETGKAWNRFLSGRNAPSLPMTGVRSLIYQSWVRSNSTGIKPEQFAAPFQERTAATSKLTSDLASLRRATRASLAHIGDLLRGAEAMLILTDPDGVILETVGDSSTLTKADKINLSVGGAWSELASGTNGIGTALWAGQPVYVHGEEHFCEGMKAWSCAAAPIRDPIDRSIIGVIDLSGLTAIFQKHNAAFAATAARDIEIALEQEQSLLNMRLMEAIIGIFPASRQEQNEGLAIIDRFGRLIFNKEYCAEPGHSGKEIGLGTRFMELPDGISEDKILAALPAGHDCQDIKLIKIDGDVKGAALVFKAAHTETLRLKSPPVLTLPGVIIGTSDLKIVGKSDVILEALDAASRIASSDVPTLIEGETGVGKELFARLIHSRMRPASSRRFSAVSCGGITQELFHEWLSSRKPDANPEAAGRIPNFAGFLCLDEIGELPADVQPFLLRLLEERMTSLTGPDEPGPSARVLSLTNRVMRDEVEAGRFRRDLFYRLSTIVLKIPPLRDRGEDILLIAEHYNRKISQETGRGQLMFSDDIRHRLLTHPWPGNVRELRNVISHLHVLAKARQVTLDDLPRDLVEHSSPHDVQRFASAAHETRIAGSESLKQAEVLLIENSLTLHRGNMTRAAIALGISRPTLYRKMQSHGIVIADTKAKVI